MENLEDGLTVKGGQRGRRYDAGEGGKPLPQRERIGRADRGWDDILGAVGCRPVPTPLAAARLAVADRPSFGPG
jgi:hypothetical protein